MIYIVGSGPGDKELLTVKGKMLLECAGAVMYTGTTVDEEILEYCKDSAEIVNSAGMNLERIMGILKKWVDQHDVIVRLHSGDPVVYGAIGEEMEAFRREGIPFEVVPGVSAYSALAAKVRMELTVPEVVQSVLITRLPGRTIVPEDIDVLLSQQPTVAIYLSGARGEDLLKKLKEFYPEDAVLTVGHRVSRWGEIIVSKRLSDWENISFPENLTLFLIRKSAVSRRSRLYSDER